MLQFYKAFRDVILRTAQPFEGPYDGVQRRCSSEGHVDVGISGLPVDITKAFRRRTGPRAGIAAARDDNSCECTA